jgi:DNA replication protein DnaC
MTEELEPLMKSLHLKRTLETYSDQLKAAEKEDITYSDFLARLLRAEWHSRQEQSLKARIKRARFPEVWSLETFPFSKQPGINKRQIRSLADLEFIPKAENIVFIGKSSMGKTGLASGLLLKSSRKRLSRPVHPGTGSVR